MLSVDQSSRYGLRLQPENRLLACLCYILKIALPVPRVSSAARAVLGGERRIERLLARAIANTHNHRIKTWAKATADVSKPALPLFGDFWCPASSPLCSCFLDPKPSRGGLGFERTLVVIDLLEVVPIKIYQIYIYI